MPDNVLKMELKDGKLEEIDDFGIFYFFSTSDHNIKKNLVATITRNGYFMTMEDAHLIYHNELEMMLINMVDDIMGNISLHINAYNDKITIWVGRKMSVFDYEVILGIVNETIKYTEMTGINKCISIKVPHIHGYFDTDYDVDLLVNKLNEVIHGSFKTFEKKYSD